MLICYTSGTTGKTKWMVLIPYPTLDVLLDCFFFTEGLPKGVMLTNKSLLATIAGMRVAFVSAQQQINLLTCQEKYLTSSSFPLSPFQRILSTFPSYLCHTSTNKLSRYDFCKAHMPQNVFRANLISVSAFSSSFYTNT